MKPNKLALPDVPRALRDVVVTETRAKWKTRHQEPNERQMRMIRFLWMRHPFYWADRQRLHGGTLGALLRAGLVERDRAVLKLTRRGGEVLEHDRRTA
jgi:hypothetical protein